MNQLNTALFICTKTKLIITEFCYFEFMKHYLLKSTTIFGSHEFYFILFSVYTENVVYIYINFVY